MDQQSAVANPAIQTYRYLRIGIVGAVGLLAVSILFERAEADCWQNSVSAYYYTPVRAIFVGALMAIGLCLIVIKGRTTPVDISLNVAGMLAPVVAVIPTTNVGTCWSVTPEPLPLNSDGTLADWVVANVDNNFKALLVAGIVGLIVAAVIATIHAERLTAIFEVGATSMRWGLAIALALLLGGLAAFLWWDDFYTKAHAYAAVAMFVFLALAVALNAWDRYRSGAPRRYGWFYLAILLLMVGAAVGTLLVDRDDEVLLLEATEIFLFAVFWLVQTNEHWNETV